GGSTARRRQQGGVSAHSSSRPTARPGRFALRSRRGTAMNTDALIDRLAESATPVQRLKPAWVRAAGWLALGVPPLLAIAFIDGIRTYPRDFIGDGGRLIEVAAILATAATAAIAALAATVPGAS